MCNIFNGLIVKSSLKNVSCIHVRFQKDLYMQIANKAEAYQMQNRTLNSLTCHNNV